MKKILVTIVLLAAFGSAGLAWAVAPPPEEGCAPPPKGLPPQLVEVLKLSADQRIQIDALLETEHTRSETLRQQMIELRRELDAAETQTTFDEAAIRSRALDLTQLEADLTVIRIGTRVKINTLLNEEQRKLFRLLEPKHQRPPLPPPGQALSPTQGS